MARKVKAIELVLDWNLWPRHESHGLDQTNLSRIKEALRNGIDLPPIIVNIHDNRVVDGFHRTRAALDVFGDGAEILADLRDFQNEAEMFVEAGRTNANHGLPMGPQDRVHFALKARKLKIPLGLIAQVLGSNKEKLEQFLKERTATNRDGETVALPHGAKNLAGKKLSSDEEHFVDTIGANIPEMHISMLINALNAPRSIKFTDKTLERLKELRNLIDEIIRRES